MGIGGGAELEKSPLRKRTIKTKREKEPSEGKVLQSLLTKKDQPLKPGTPLSKECLKLRLITFTSRKQGTFCPSPPLVLDHSTRTRSTPGDD
jgi:hypothetical protein